jgi:hypothetical protein
MNNVIECNDCKKAKSKLCPYNSKRLRGYICPLYENNSKFEYVTKQGGKNK